MTIRVLVTGSREMDNASVVNRALGQIVSDYGFPEPADVTLIEGGAAGADKLAADVARRLGWEVETHRAVWYPDGYQSKRDHLAGFKRNQRMVDSGADVCIAFIGNCRKQTCNRAKPHYSHGTADCVERAEAAGIPVRRYRV